MTECCGKIKAGYEGCQEYMLQSRGQCVLLQGDIGAKVRWQYKGRCHDGWPRVSRCS